jgi:CHAD domain-containing protein
MQLNTKPTVKTLADSAYLATKQHFKKAIKWEKSVAKDEDPEALHQMRVGMRRLRTVVTEFGHYALKLPKSVNDKNIGKISRRLGSLRDMDVLKATLINRYQPHLPNKEQKSLQSALNSLDEQRAETLAAVRSTFKTQTYKSLKQDLREWLAEPNYQAIACLPIQEVLPNLLLPELSRFLLHPGWLFGTQIEDSAIAILPSDKIESVLAHESDTLHSLRKEAKRIRYQMELFQDFYGQSYSAYLADVTTIQEILGQIQDSVVLGEWLTDLKKLPTLAHQLKQNRFVAWQNWLPLQQRYLNGETQHHFQLTLLHPKEIGINE